MKLKKLVCTGLAAVLMAASMTGCGGNGGRAGHGAGLYLARLAG